MDAAILTGLDAVLVHGAVAAEPLQWRFNALKECLMDLNLKPLFDWDERCQEAKQRRKKGGWCKASWRMGKIQRRLEQSRSPKLVGILSITARACKLAGFHSW